MSRTQNKMYKHTQTRLDILLLHILVRYRQMIRWLQVLYTREEAQLQLLQLHAQLVVAFLIRLFAQHL